MKLDGVHAIIPPMAPAVAREATVALKARGLISDVSVKEVVQNPFVTKTGFTPKSGGGSLVTPASLDRKLEEGGAGEMAHQTADEARALLAGLEGGKRSNVTVWRDGATLRAHAKVLVIQTGPASVISFDHRSASPSALRTELRDVLDGMTALAKAFHALDGLDGKGLRLEAGDASTLEALRGMRVTVTADRQPNGMDILLDAALADVKA